MSEFFIDAMTLKEGFTQSEITTWDHCAYKWYLSYNLRLKKSGSFSWALVVGTAWHKIMEQVYMSKGKRWAVPELEFPEGVVLSNDEEATAEYWTEILNTLAEEYLQYYKDDFKVFKIDPDNGIEYLADLEIELDDVPIRLQGKLDLRGNLGGNLQAIGDHKTAARFADYLTNGWDFKFQFMFYVWLDRHKFGKMGAKSFLVNGVKKPELRKGAKETHATFIERCKADIKSRPDDYFKRQRLDLTAHAMQNFERDILLPKLQRIKIISDPNAPEELKQMVALNKNTDACHAWNRTCEFFAICQNGLKNEFFNYETKPVKHAELSEE